MYKLFLDDERLPISSDFIVARNCNDAIHIVFKKGFPTFVSFDHDLGNHYSGYDFAKWLVEYDLETHTMPKDFSFYVHSQNPIGKENIEIYLHNYLRSKVK